MFSDDPVTKLVFCYMRGGKQSRERFRRDSSALPDVFDFVSDFLSSHGVGGEAAYAINLSVEELFTNAVKYDNEKSEPVLLELRADDHQIVVVFSAPGGTPFDITKALPVEVDRPVSDIRPGGLGLHLVRLVMDEIEYHYDDRTSVITMTKKLE